MTSIFIEKPDPLELRLRLRGFRGWLLIWLPCLIAAFVIANESTARFSAENTSNNLRPIFQLLFGHVSDEVWSISHKIFRKSGHFCGYGLVCLTFVRAWLLRLGCLADLPQSIWRRRAAGLGLLCAFLVASADEYHQTFLPSRTGQFSDVLIDTSGGVLACALVWAIVWRKEQHRGHGNRRGGRAVRRAA